MVAQIDKKYILTRPYKVYTRLVGYIFFEGRPFTTKGQWINPFLLNFFSLINRLPKLKKVVKPVFILGTGRSGTTVLGTIFSMHKELGYLNEPKALWHKIYPYEDLIGTYSSNNAKYRLGRELVTTEIKDRSHRLYGAYLMASFSSRVVDKYPELIFRIPFVLEIFPDAKFLFLVRNGWDTCHSINHWSERLGIDKDKDKHDWWGVNRRKWNLLIEQIIPEHKDLSPYANDMRKWTNQKDMAAVEWIVSMREGLKALKTFPGKIYRINYEQLCNTDDVLLEELVNFLDLDSNDEIFFEYARSILKQANTKEEFSLHPSIKKQFKETMILCGYN